MSDQFFRSRCALLLLLYLLLALLHSAVNPLFESSDEMWHIGMAVRLARGEGLPVQHPGEETPWRQEGSQPPLYYALLAGLTRLLGLPLNDFEAIYFPNPHACLGMPPVLRREITCYITLKKPSSGAAPSSPSTSGGWSRWPWAC